MSQAGETHLRHRTTNPRGGWAPPTTCLAPLASSFKNAGTSPATLSTTAEPHHPRDLLVQGEEQSILGKGASGRAVPTGLALGHTQSTPQCSPKPYP